LLFLEVFEDLDFGGAFAHSVSAKQQQPKCKQQKLCAVCLLIGVGSPHKLEGSAKALVAPCQSSVNDVLAVTTDDDKAAVRVVLKGLRVNFAAAELLDGRRKSLAVLGQLLVFYLFIIIIFYG